MGSLKRPAEPVGVVAGLLLGLPDGWSVTFARGGDELTVTYSGTGPRGEWSYAQRLGLKMVSSQPERLGRFMSKAVGVIRRDHYDERQPEI